MLNDDIKHWVEAISRPTELLGGLSVCPYARSAEYSLHETDGSDISPPPWDFELMIYLLPAHYTAQEVIDIADAYNKNTPDMVFLPDPKDRYTEINGVQTNNGKHNLILCQWRDNLEKAREKLSSTAYYSYWAADYLKEIVET